MPAWQLQTDDKIHTRAGTLFHTPAAAAGGPNPKPSTLKGGRLHRSWRSCRTGSPPSPPRRPLPLWRKAWEPRSPPSTTASTPSPSLLPVWARCCPDSASVTEHQQGSLAPWCPLVEAWGMLAASGRSWGCCAPPCFRVQGVGTSAGDFYRWACTQLAAPAFLLLAASIQPAD